MRMKILLAILFLASSTLADVIHLSDGSTLTGEIKRATNGWYITTADGKTKLVTNDEVKSIELAPRGNPKEVSASRLISLRHSSEAVSDIKVIIDRYEKFIEQNKGMPVEADAAKDL